MQNTRKGIILLELMVAIAIITSLTFLTWPAYRHMSRESRLNNAAQSVLAAAHYARQQALSSANPTYLVFSDENTEDASKEAYRSFAVYSIQINTASGLISQNNGQWILNWQQLPEGIVFDREVERINLRNIFDPSADAWSGALIKGQNLLYIDGKNYPVIGYQPNGQTDKWRRIYLAHGFYHPSPECPTIFRTATEGCQIHFDETGRCRVTRLYYSSNDLQPYIKD